MENFRRRRSMVRLAVELYEEIIVLFFVELKLAAIEIKGNIRSVEKGAAKMVVGAGLLFFAVITFLGTAVAILALFLPTWLSALLVTLTLAFFGVAFFFTGLGNFKHFTLIPSETLQRVHDITNRYKRVGAHHEIHTTRSGPEAEHEGSIGQGRIAQ